MSEVRRQKTEDRGQKSVVSCQKSVIRKARRAGRSEDGGRRTEDRTVSAQARRVKTTQTTVILAAGIKSQRSVIRGQRVNIRRRRKIDDRALVCG